MDSGEMMTDTTPSSIATVRPFGVGIVSWGDYTEGYEIPLGHEEDEVCRPVQSVNIGYSVWKDMIEEPWKYGDDIGDWLALDAELRGEEGRWRLDAYWGREQQRINWERLEAMLWKAWNDYLARKEKAVVRIQSAVRGHLVRNRIPWRNCAMCLAHHVSPIRTTVGFMCRKCSCDGPFVDLIGMDDPWEWFRAEKA